MSQPLVSVIMPVYNAGEYLTETIGSILNQTLNDFEFIIVNDASTDNSKDIIHSFQDNRIRYFENEKNEGYIHSLNAALQLVKGDFVARMDADDFSMPNRFSEQHAFLLHESSVDLVGASIKVDREDSAGERAEEIWDYPTSPGGVKARLFFNTAHAHPVVFFRRSLIDRKLYEYEPSFYPAEDYRLWVKLNRYVNTSNLNQSLLRYRVSKSQTSHYALEKQKHNSALIRANYFQSRLLSEFGNVEKDTYTFWHTGFRIDKDAALLIFKGFESIYNQSTDINFRKELSIQMNSVVTRIYQLQPLWLKAYSNSVFAAEAPLTLMNRAKFFLYPVWNQFKQVR